MDGKGMAQIVQARLTPRTAGSPDSRLCAHPAKVSLERILDNPSSFARSEKRGGLTRSRDRRGPAVGIRGQGLVHLGPEGHESGLVELGQANGQQAVLEVDVRSVQADDLAIAEARAVEQQKNGAEGDGVQGTLSALVAIGRVQQALQFLTRVNVRDELRGSLRHYGR